jgi:iron complex outermembrane receptor protein
MLWKPLDGFGAQLNYSNTDSAINIPTPAGKTSDGGGNLATIPMPGLSKAVMNRSLYYEANGFQFRISNRKRSDFLGNVVDVTTDQRTYTYVRGESVSDVQIGYEFQTGYLKGLSLLMQGNNITNTKFEQYNPVTGETIKSFDYGKSYAVTANYKF